MSLIEREPFRYRPNGSSFERPRPTLATPTAIAFARQRSTIGGMLVGRSAENEAFDRRREN
jgi:hypothetical protein